MATIFSDPSTAWTAADLVERFGPIPLARIVLDPAPGIATVEDVVRLDDHHDRLCELIDGILLEKTKGFKESFLGVRLVALLAAFVGSKQLGIVTGADGMIQLFPEQVRIPDIAFFSWERLEGSGFPDEAAPHMSPDLAIEILSPSNTQQEMDRKLQEYFEAGVRLVWYIEPRQKTVRAYTAADQVTELGEKDTLTGGDVLPGFELSLAEFFVMPTPDKK